MVFVLDKHKKPLMPCTEKRARLLLQRGRAVVHKMAPFTIRLKDLTLEESTTASNTTLTEVRSPVWYIWKYATLMGLASVVLFAINGITAPAQLWFIERVVDIGARKVAGERDVFWAIAPWLLGAAITIIIRDIQPVLQSLVRTRLVQRIRLGLDGAVLHKISSLDYLCFEDTETQDLIARIGTSPGQRICDIFFSYLYMVSLVISAAGLVMLLIRIGWWTIAVIAILFFIPTLLSNLAFAKAHYSLQVEQTRQQRKLGYLARLLTGRQEAKELRLFGLGPHLIKSWQELFSEVLRRRTFLDIRLAAKSYWVIGLDKLSLFGILVVLCYSLARGGMTIGQFIALAGAAIQMLELVSFDFGYATREIKETSIYMEDLKKFSQLPETSLYTGGKLHFPKPIRDGIEFIDVSFRYPGSERLVLRNLTF